MPMTFPSLKTAAVSKKKKKLRRGGGRVNLHRKNITVINFLATQILITASPAPGAIAAGITANIITPLAALITAISIGGAGAGSGVRRRRRRGGGTAPRAARASTGLHGAALGLMAAVPGPTART